jgi:Glycosyltransferase family 87
VNKPLRIVCIVAVVGILAYLFVRPPRLPAEDFIAFYCGSETLRTGHDPYRYQPLENCETREFQARYQHVALPDPLPPYAIAALTPLTWLSLDRALLVWLLLLAAGLMATVIAVAQIADLPPPYVGAVIIPNAMVSALSIGQLAPLPIGLLCLAALMIVKHKWGPAAVLIGGATLEPHLAGPVALASLVLVPSMRLPLALVGAAIVALSLVVGRWPLHIEYLTQVLPAHARSELNNPGQYSLSALLHAVGVSTVPALALGTAQYAFMVVLGIWMASKLRDVNAASIVLVPMAFAVVGGSFIHVTQLAAMLPLALCLFAWTGTVSSILALFFLAMPWQAILDFRQAPVVWPAIFAILTFRTRIGRLTGAILATALCALLWVLGARLTPNVPAALFHLAAQRPDALVEDVWRAINDAWPREPLWWPERIATFTGAFLVLASTLLFARRVDTRFRAPRDVTPLARARSALG